MIKRHRHAVWGVASVSCLLASTVLMTGGVRAAETNPVPYTNQPLVPDAAIPGGPAFTLTVNGTGFVSTSVVHWNGSSRTTTFIGQGQVTATISASDIAQAGTASVTVVNPGPGGGTSAAVFFPIAAPSASVSLTRTDLSSSGGNIQVVTADFNGDGKLDLATAEYYDSSVRIFLGNGDGTFRIGPTYLACQADTLVTGDFNGDGIVDLAVGARGCGQITIFLGNGDGTFRESGGFATGPGIGFGAPYRLAVGDFNSDGRLDLVAANESNILSVLLGNGDGTFQTHVDYDVGRNTKGVTTGDFNGDGHLDLAATATESVSILLGNGDGTFRTPSCYSLQAGTVLPCSTDGAEEVENANIIAADLNGDSKLDLVLPNGNGFVSVLLGNGDGTFHGGGNYATGGISVDVAAADLNGGGTLDLAVTNYVDSENISLLLGNGDGTFRTHIDYAANRGARGLVAADFNGDGRLDLAVGNQAAVFGGVDSISIFLAAPGVDTTAPTVGLLRTIAGPPKQVQISSRDYRSGLRTIQALACSNCFATTAPFVQGTTDPVITTATKTDATKSSSVQVKATDMAGNSTIFDPVDITIEGDGKPEVHTMSISSLEHVVQISNGTPGIHHMVLKVNQVEIPVSPLKNGEKRSLDIGTALSAGNNNLITLTAFGGRQATAWIVFTEP
jgi:hypothetical protein